MPDENLFVEVDGEKRDPIVEAVREDLLARSRLGLAKYGTPLSRGDLSLRDWLQHAYEEALDCANYLKRAIVSLDTDKAVLAKQILDWIDDIQPDNLKNRSIADLQDELYRRRQAIVGDPTVPIINTDKVCPHGFTPRTCSECSY